MSRTKFPKLIHVTRDVPEDGPWLEVHTDGVACLQKDGQAVAIYELRSVGGVRIRKQYEERLPVQTVKKR